MASEIEKREKARRVWRLNKKEGIPVLEALESVDIGKDVYYRIKDEREEQWRDEILTAEQVQKQLEELAGQLDEIEERAEAVDERLAEAEERADEIEMDANWYDRVAEARDMAHDQKIRLDNFAERIGWDVKVDDERETNVVEIRELDRRVSSLEGSMSAVQDAVSELDSRLSDVKKKGRRKRRELRERLENKPETLLGLLRENLFGSGQHTSS